MNFQSWLQIGEMAHVGIKQHIKISCDNFKFAQCKNQPIAMLDMRFEDPGAYQPPTN